MITRRSLLQTAALAPLLIPRHGLARVGGGAAAVVAGPGPCGSPISITNANVGSVIAGPGCYQVMENITAAGFDVSPSNVTILGNGHTISPTMNIGAYPTFDGVGIIVRDLTVLGGMHVYGNHAGVQTPTALTLKNLIVGPGEPGNGSNMILHGDNIVVDSCTFVGDVTSSDDTVATFPAQFGSINNTVNSWVTFNNCTFGPCFDLGIEGIGGWDHFTFTGCRANQAVQADSGVGGGMGGWWGPNGPSGSYTFTVTNSLFTGNTVKGNGNGFVFTNGSGILIGGGSDAACNAQWGTPGAGGGSGNVFGGAGALANIYSG